MNKSQKNKSILAYNMLNQAQAFILNTHYLQKIY